MAHLSQFLRLVHPLVPGCPDFLAVAALKASAVEFCERTRCWRVISSATLSAQGQALVAQLGATVHVIEEATLDGQPLEPIQFTDVIPDELTGETMEGAPKFITQIEPGKVQIYPFVAGGVLRVSAFLKPRSDALYNTDVSDPFYDAYANVPDFLIENDAEAIANGAIYRLKMMPEQRFFDPSGAGVARAQFDAACDGRFGRSLRGQQRAKIRTKPHWI